MLRFRGSIAKFSNMVFAFAVCALSGCASDEPFRAPSLEDNLSRSIVLVRERIKVASDSTPATAPDVEHNPRRGEDTENSFIASVEIKPVKQEDLLHWCWAACAQMIHAYYGKTYSQSELAELIHGTDAAGEARIRAAAYREIMIALNPELPQEIVDGVRRRVIERPATPTKSTVRFDADSYVEARYMQLAINSDDLVDELRNGAPLVVVLNEGKDAAYEHAYVLHSVTYAVERRHVIDKVGEGMKKVGDAVGDGLGGIFKSNHQQNANADVLEVPVPRKYGLRSVKLIDPAVGQSKDMPAAEFRDRVKLLISKSKAKEIITKEYEVLEINEQ